jgi:CHAT domain-containing protein
VVLSSCEAAATAALQGDAVLGLSSVLLRLGVTTLIAPVLEIPDDTTGPVMVDLHGRLAAGVPPVDALSAAVAAAPDGSPQERAVRAAFVVMGAGTHGAR